MRADVPLRSSPPECRIARPGARHRRARRLRARADYRRAEPAQQVDTAVEARQAGWRRSPGSAGLGRRWSVLAAPLASARRGRPGSDENAPSANMARLASANPSDRPTVSPLAASRYFQRGPAPASSRTLMMARSKAARARSLASRHAVAAVDLAPPIATAHNEMPPARVEGHVERGIGFARGLHDQVRRRIEAARDRRGNAAARPRARSPAVDARARAPPWRSKGKKLPLSRASRAHVRSRRISTCRASGRRRLSHPAA